jgi:hypothetical protein
LKVGVGLKAHLLAGKRLRKIEAIEYEAVEALKVLFLKSSNGETMENKNCPPTLVGCKDSIPRIPNISTRRDKL